MRAVLQTVLRTLDLATTKARPEQPRVHHVTLVPSRGGRVVVERRSDWQSPAATS